MKTFRDLQKFCNSLDENELDSPLFKHILTLAEEDEFPKSAEVNFYRAKENYYNFGEKGEKLILPASEIRVKCSEKEMDVFKAENKPVFFAGQPIIEINTV